jgi:hypothetical protein
VNPIVISVGPLAAASANAIALSQTPGGAGAFTLNGASVVAGVAVLDKPRRVLLTFAASEVGHNFVVTGTDWAGNVISETIAGTGIGTVASVLDYKTVTSVTISAAATGAIQVGTNGVAGSPWARMDGWAAPSIAAMLAASGTVNYTLQQTLDDPNSPTNPVLPANMTWINSGDAAAVAATGNIQSSYTYVPVFIRVLLNSGTGTVTATLQQASSVPK